MEVWEAGHTSSQGRRQEFKEGGAELKGGCEGAPKIFGDRKPHLLIND